MSYFGKNLKKIRNLKSLSQKELAETFNLKRGTLGAYEEGRSEPKIETLIQVANHFSIPIDSFLTRELSINELLKFNTQLTTDESMLRKTFPKIPIILKENISNYLKYHEKSAFIQDMSYVEFPVKEEQLVYRAYQVQDLEMSDHQGGFYPGDVVIGVQSNLEAFTEEHLGIVVAEEIQLRSVLYFKDEVHLKALHPAIDDVKIAATLVKEVWKVLGVYQGYRHSFQLGIHNF